MGNVILLSREITVQQIICVSSFVVFTSHCMVTPTVDSAIIKLYKSHVQFFYTGNAFDKYTG
jgi:hypothetical protein